MVCYHEPLRLRPQRWRVRPSRSLCPNVTTLWFLSAGAGDLPGRPVGLLPHWKHAETASGMASWYGEPHRGRLMANGERFNPDKRTAASWDYPLGTKVRVTLSAGTETARSVVVTVTDRGPARELVQRGRIIDLSQGAFAALANCDMGLIKVTVEQLPAPKRELRGVPQQSSGRRLSNRLVSGIARKTPSPSRFA